MTMNILSRSIYEKVKQHWGWVQKSVAYKKVCISLAPLMILPRSWCFCFEVRKTYRSSNDGARSQ